MSMSKTVNSKGGALVRDVVVFLLLGAFGLSGEAETPEQRTENFSSQYGVIVERNIFSRYRGRRTAVRQQDNGAARQPSPPAPESYFVLKGLAREDDSFVALFEDTRSGDIIRIKPEDAIAGGKVTKLTLDSAVYQQDSNTVSVKVGETLEGKLGATAPTVENLMEWSRTEPSSPNEPPAEGAETPSVDEAEILRKLMERRRQQLGD
jgi:hypothetical protein